MPITGQLVVARVEHLVEHVVHRLHQVMACTVVGGQIHMTFRTAQEAVSCDVRKVFLVFLGKPNKGVGCRNFARVFVGK